MSYLVNIKELKASGPRKIKTQQAYKFNKYTHPDAEKPY
jgi:hypothetical protein